MILGLERSRDASGAHHENPVGERERFVDVMRHDQHARLMQRDEFLDEAVHPDASERIEGREGLVEQQQRRVVNERARQRHPLRLTARQIARPVVLTSGESDFGKRARRAFAADRVLVTERDVLP